MNFVKIFLCLCFLTASGALFCEDVQKEGKDILEKSDKRFFPEEGSIDFFVTSDDQEGHREYKMQGYKKGYLNQTIVWVSPEINKNDVGMRSGDTIYYYIFKINKTDIMSYQAVFLESSFSWGDVVSSELATDYKVTNLQKSKYDDKDVYYLVLAPNRSSLYARVDIWIDSNTFDTYKRLYFTASGEKLKMATFSDIKVKDEIVVGFKINMEDYISENKAMAELSNIKKIKLPKSLFGPQNISSIHAR